MLPFLLAPLLSSFLAPAATSAMAGLGLGSLAPVAGSALTGAVTSGVMGGNPLSGALTGGLTGGLGQGIGALTDGLNAGSSLAAANAAANPIITPTGSTIAPDWYAPSAGNAALPFTGSPGGPPVDLGVGSSTFTKNLPTPKVWGKGWSPDTPWTGSGPGGPATVINPAEQSSTFTMNRTPPVRYPDYPPPTAPVYAPPTAEPAFIPAAEPVFNPAPAPVVAPAPDYSLEPYANPYMDTASAGPTDLVPEPSFFDKATGWMAENPLLTLGIGAYAVDSIGSMFDKKKKKKKDSDYVERFGSRTVTPAPAGYRHGIQPEWNFISYDRGFKDGGGVFKMGLGSMLLDRLQDPLGPWELLARGKIGKAAKEQFGFAAGGEIDAEAVAGNPMTGPMSDTSSNPVDIAVEEAIMALQGQHPNPEMALERLRELIGDEMFDEFMDMMVPAGERGAIQGPGDGQSDGVPAMIDGKEPARLSSGEFVVPADAVSGIGNGDTNSGVAALQQMVGNVRQKRGMKDQLPPAINPMEVMPA